jgi:hypothetical protein
MRTGGLIPANLEVNSNFLSFCGLSSKKGSKKTTMPSLRFLPLCIAASALFCCSASIAQDAASSTSPPQSAVRIVDRIDDSQLVTLKGNTHPAAAARNDRGRVSPDLPMTDLILVLRRSPEQQAAFDRFVETLYDPSSPNYHQWLEPEEVGERFGPEQSDIDVTANWLRGHGFSIDEVTKDRMSIRFSGTAGQVESTFHTEIHNLDVKGVRHIANMSDPKLPAALTPVVVGVKALHSFMPRPLHRLGSRVKFDREAGRWERIASPETDESQLDNQGLPTTPRPLFGINVPASGGNDAYLVEDVAPNDFATIYNVTPAWNAGYDGTGQTIAIAGTSDIEPADVSTFRRTFGLPAGLAVIQEKGVNGLDPGICTSTSSTATCGIGDLTENTLDVEWSGAVAKGAQIVLVTSGSKSATDDTVYDSSSYVVQKRTAPILNVSYGLCELGEGTSGNTLFNNMWESAYSEGIAVFAAAGDSGSASCDQGGDVGGSNVPYVAEYGLTVSGIASTPYNTAVGGTDLNWCPFNNNANCTAAPYWSSSNSATTGASALGYIPEVPWNDTCTSPWSVAFLDWVGGQTGLGGVSDAESACNFVIANYQLIYQNDDVDLAPLVDTIGGGGGKSTCTTSNGQTPSSCAGGYAKPTWQAGVTGIPSDGHRDLPDVSFFASNGFLGSAYLVCVSANGACVTTSTAGWPNITTEPTAQEIGGTSVASPAMAGVMALVNQKAGAPQGNPNTMLYKFASKQSYASCSAESVKNTSACYFNDIDKGSNIQPCDWGLIQGDSPNCQVIHSGDVVGTLEGYDAVTGFDNATGLGSLNVANVVNAWPVAMIPVASLSETALTFAATAEGTASAGQVITLKNTGKETLTLSGTGKGISITGTDASSFSETNTCGTSVGVGDSCTITVVFKPAAAGALSATLSLADNGYASPQTVALTGTSTVPIVKFSTISLGFAPTALGGSATSQVILSNAGTATLHLNGAGEGISITGTDASSFSQSNNCGTGVAMGKSCTINVTFTPRATGLLKAAVNIAFGAAGSPQQLPLTGTGSGPAVSLSASKLAFFSTRPDVASAAQEVTLKNTGSAPLSLSRAGQGISIAGTDATSFEQTNTCGTSVAAGKSCIVTVTFKPITTGTLTASVRIADSANPSTQEIALSGTGTGAIVSLSHTSLKFPNTVIGVSSATQLITLTNKGNSTLGVAGSGHSILITGADASSFSQTNTCGSAVEAGKSCFVTVTFKPRASGTLTAAVTFTDNTATSPQSVELTGTGQ